MPIVLPGEPGPLPVHLRRPFTPGDPRIQRRYARQTRNILAASIRGTEQDLRRIRGAMVALDRRIRALLATVDFTPITLPSIQIALTNEIAAIEVELQAIARGGINAAATAGEFLVTSPVATLGTVGTGGAGTIGISRELIDIASQHTADLIGFNRGGLSANLLRKVNTEVNLATMGARGGTEAIRNISRTLGQGGAFTTQAERIYRTEALRIFSMASQATAEQMPEEAGLQKAWVWSRVGRLAHARAEDTQGPDSPIPVNQAFRVGGEALMQPRDPAGSAANTVNCGCYAVYPPRAFGEEGAGEIYRKALEDVPLPAAA